jgi:thioredoxin reductase (NADPH)
MAGLVKEIEAAQFEADVLGGERVAVDFYSTDCPPCEALAPKYEGLAELYGKDIRFVKIYRQGNRALADSLGVRGSPTVLFYDHGRPVGQTLRGGIRRAELIHNLDALLPEGRAEEIRSRIRPSSDTCDVLILGGGPAGLAAAIYAAQARLDTVLVDSGLTGGQVSTTHQVSNYPGFVEPQSGYMLSHAMSEQAKAAGARFKVAVDITRVDLDKREVVIDGTETIRAGRIILATGSSPRLLGVPGEREYKGQGISYCATCDAKYFEDKEVIVVGGGNTAVEESLFIARFARRITVVHQFDHLQANKAAQEKAFANERIQFLWSHEPRGFSRNGKDGGPAMEVEVEDLKSGERRTLKADGVFVFVGMEPNLEILQGRPLERDRWGYVRVDEDMHTSIPGVFAVGDIRSKAYRQITTAVADGTVAAIAAAREMG